MKYLLILALLIPVPSRAESNDISEFLKVAETLACAVGYNQAIKDLTGKDVTKAEADKSLDTCRAIVEESFKSEEI